MILEIAPFHEPSVSSDLMKGRDFNCLSPKSVISPYINWRFGANGLYVLTLHGYFHSGWDRRGSYVLCPSRISEQRGTRDTRAKSRGVLLPWWSDLT